MRLSLRFIIPLLIALAAFAYAAVPLADALMERWFVRDLDIRSSSIAAAVQEPLTHLIVTGTDPRIAQFFNRMLQDERGLEIRGTMEPGSQPEMPLEQGARLTVQRKNRVRIHAQEHSLKP